MNKNIKRNIFCSVIIFVVLNFVFVNKTYSQFGLRGDEQIITAGCAPNFRPKRYWNDRDFLYLNFSYDYVINRDYSIGGVIAGGSSGHYSSLILAGKGSYHFYSDEVFDIYATAILGLNFNDIETLISPIFFGTVIGSRFNIVEQFGAFIEAGYGLAYVNTGLAFQF
jgi:hypothetical protein